MNFALRSSRHWNPASGKKNASVFAFQPAKAGSGATTTALFVANILATLAEKKVLVLECDLHAGPISMLYNLRPTYSIMDALEDSHRLTDESWNEMVTHTGGIDVLSSVSRLGVRQVSPWGYQRLLSFVRSRYDVIIADLPEVVNNATEVVARAAQAVFVVTSPCSPALYLAARRRYDLEARGVATTKVKYIVNRKTAERAIPREAGWAIDAEKIAVIPLDPSLVDASEFKVDLIEPATLAEYTKVAEFCCGRIVASEAFRLPPVLDGGLAARVLALSRTLLYSRALIVGIQQPVLLIVS